MKPQTTTALKGKIFSLREQSEAKDKRQIRDSLSDVRDKEQKAPDIHITIKIYITRE